jgi:ankyrin repeat protein
MKIIHKDNWIRLEDADLFINKGNIFHMAVELNHSDYLRFLSINKVPINKLNGDKITPFHVAVIKKHRNLKLRLIKMLKEQQLSPMISFSAKDSPLKLCLIQKDLDSAYELINNDLYVSDFLDAIRLDLRADEYVTRLLIELFPLFVDNHKKCSAIADVIIKCFGGDVSNYHKGVNPILEACSEGRFQCLQYVIDRELILDWDKLKDKVGKNIFHYASEQNEYKVVKIIVKQIIDNDISYECLQNLIFCRCHIQGFIPKLYADPHRAICKYFAYLEKLVVKKSIEIRRKEEQHNNITNIIASFS